MAYFDCIVGGSGKGNTLVVTCADDLAGATITCTNGTKTYTKTCPSTAPYEVTFYGLAAGTWTVSATVSGNTYTTTVVITDYEAELGGFNWKAWVDLSENYTSSDFTDLDELLDTELAVRELMSIHACVDYLADIATTSEDVETIIENDLCAKWINNRDYALDTLYANEIIAGYMDAADKYGYGEWCLMPQVPIMTSDTTPSGTVFSSTADSSGPAYYAFLRQPNAYFTGENNGATAGEYVGHHHIKPVSAKKIRVYIGSYWGYNSTIVAQGSNDGINWVDVSEEEIVTSPQYPNNTYTSIDFNIIDDSAYEYHRILRRTNAPATGFTEYDYFYVADFNIYDYAPKGNIPIMTANNAPYGVASATSVYSSSDAYQAYRAFRGKWDGTGGSGNCWQSEASQTTNQRLVYKSTNPICVKAFEIMNTPSTTESPKTVKLQGSNDGTNWEDISEVITCDTTASKRTRYTVENDDYYLYIGLLCLTNNGGSVICINTLQFYGRELSVSVPTMTSNTTPYGEVVYSSQYDPTSYAAYKAFASDNFFSTPDNSITNQYIGYRFTNPVNVKKVFLTNRSNALANSAKNIYIEYSNDGTNWSRASEQLTNPNSAVTTCFETNTDVLALYWRIFILDNYGGTQINVVQLQFYGLDYSEKEFEEGTTKKWLYDHGVELETIENSALAGTLVKGSNSMILTNPASGVGRIATANAIDVSDYELYRMKVGSPFTLYSDSYGATLGLSTAKDTYTNKGYANAEKSGIPNNVGFDISSVNENVYPWIFQSNFAGTWEITEWWLE